MGDVSHSLYRHRANFHFILFFSQKKEEHIDKNIRDKLMAITNHCTKSGCGLVAGEAGSKDFNHYHGRRLLSLSTWF